MTATHVRPTFARTVARRSPDATPNVGDHIHIHLQALRFLGATARFLHNASRTNCGRGRAVAFSPVSGCQTFTDRGNVLRDLSDSLSSRSAGLEVSPRTETDFEHEEGRVVIGTSGRAQR